MSIEELLKLIYERNASDLHITVGVPPILRVYGRLVRTEFPRLTPEDTKSLAYSLLTEKQRENLMYRESLTSPMGYLVWAGIG